MHRRRFIAALGAVGLARALPAQEGARPPRPEFACSSVLERGVVPNLVAAKVGIKGAEGQPKAQGFLQYLSEPVAEMNQCRLLDEDLLYTKWNPHLISSRALPRLEHLVADVDRLRFEIGFRTGSGSVERSWKKWDSLGVTIDEAKLFIPAALLEGPPAAPFHFLASRGGQVIARLPAVARNVGFKEGSVEGLREFFWWQKSD